jgi:N-methylhydantoinase A
VRCRSTWSALVRLIYDHVAVPLGLDLYEAAAGIMQIVNNNMVGALRVVSVEKGYDPERFALVAFGGAGPLHAGPLAQLLGTPTILIHRIPALERPGTAGNRHPA